MSEKPFKTIEEQIELLKSRGLNIDDVAQAHDFLLHNNYYRVSGYSLTLRTDDKFHSGATFNNIVDIYVFDGIFRHLLLRYLEIIEIKMKSIYAYEFSKNYGAYSYRQSAIFTDVLKHEKLIQKAESQCELRVRHETWIKHFKDLNEEIPFWAYVDLMTISDISQFYSISPLELKKAVADHFDIHKTNGASLLERFMHSVTIVRNICAHGGRLFNRIFQQKPKLSIREKELLRRDSKGDMDNAHLYSYILVMRRLLSEKDFKVLKSNIRFMSEKIPFVQLRYYGFRDDWFEVL